jgi:hypothetical protein
MRPPLYLLAVLVPFPASAASLVTYTDRSAWLADSGPISTETFEEFAPARVFGNTVTLDGIIYRTGGDFPNLVAFDGGTVWPNPGSPTVFGSQSTRSPYEMQFGGSYVLALGVQIIAPFTAPTFELRETVTVVEYDSTTTVLPIALSTPGPHFLGLTSSVGIVQVIWTPGFTEGTPTLGAIDDVSRSAIEGSGYPVQSIGIPEPSSLAMLPLGLTVVAWLARLRRRVA